MTKHTDNTSILENLQTPLNIYDHRTKRYTYANKLFAELLSKSKKEILNEQIDFTENCIHDDELLILKNSVIVNLNEVYNKFKNSLPDQFNYSLNYRLKRQTPDGKHLSVVQKTTVLEWDQHNRPCIELNMYSFTTHRNLSSKMILLINVLNEGSNEWDDVIREEFLHKPKKLGKRETEIMYLMLENKSATEISVDQNISFHTVRSHWRNILLKTNCKDQRELKHQATTMGWI